MTQGNYNRVLQVVKDGVPTARECLTCKDMKALTEFPNDVHGWMQKKSSCKECRNKRQREVEYPKNKKIGYRNRPDVLKKRYGLTLAQIEHALVQQTGLCANPGCKCEISLTGAINKNKAVIDHCHRTGMFRALLCVSCNLDLGKIEGNRTKVLGLFNYLDGFEKH